MQSPLLKLLLLCLFITPLSFAQTHSEEKKDQDDVYEKLEVRQRSDRLVGIADSATEGATGRLELEQRPILRAGELLEMSVYIIDAIVILMVIFDKKNLKRYPVFPILYRKSQIARPYPGQPTEARFRQSGKNAVA